MASIPLLTVEDLDTLGRTVNVPGRLVRSWSQLTRVVRERLMSDRQQRRGVPRSRLYRDESHYLVLTVAVTGTLEIAFGRLTQSDERLCLGRLVARWDELGLTGPYEIHLREREHTLNTVAAVLEHYLALPEPS